MKLTPSLLSLAIFATIVGCGKSDTVTIETPEGKASVTTDNSGAADATFEGDGAKVEVHTGADGSMDFKATDKDGKTSTMVAGQSFDVGELGVPIYPGSTPKEGGAAQAKVDTPEGTTLLDTRLTKDDPSKVADFFKKEIKDGSVFSQADSSVVSGKTAEGHVVGVTATRDKASGETTISISVHKPKAK